MKKLKIAIMFTAVFMLAMLMVSCEPKYAQKGEIKKYAAEITMGEDIEFIGETKEHYYKFGSKDRDLTFEVWSKPDSIIIDGSFFGYTNDYYINTDYFDMVNKYYKEYIYDLLKKYGFEDYDRSPFENDVLIKNIVFYLNNEHTDSDIRKINDFLNELSEIADSEKIFHDGKELLNINKTDFKILRFKVYLEDKNNYWHCTSEKNVNSFLSDIPPAGNKKIDITERIVSDTKTADIMTESDSIRVYVPKEKQTVNIN